jgi:hypothetical protein
MSWSASCWSCAGTLSPSALAAERLFGLSVGRPESVSYNILLKAGAGWIFDLISVVIPSCTIGLLITINVVIHFANFLIWSIPIRPAPDQEDRREN